MGQTEQRRTEQTRSALYVPRREERREICGKSDDDKSFEKNVNQGEGMGYWSRCSGRLAGKPAGVRP